MSKVLSYLFLMSSPCWALTTQPLFVIERSTNANVVHYDAQLTSDNKLNDKEPVIVYWEMKAKDGKRQDLSGIERRRAYGFQISSDPSGDGSYSLHLIPYKKRSLRVSMKDGVAIAEIEIDGKTARLEKIFIHTVGKGLIPKVDYIELSGKSQSGGTPAYEKVVSPN